MTLHGGEAPLDGLDHARSLMGVGGGLPGRYPGPGGVAGHPEPPG